MDNIQNTATELQPVHISKIYACSRVSVGSELLYICELGKYLHQCGYVLSLDGVILEDSLRNSRLWDTFRIAVTNGWVTDFGFSAVDLNITSTTNDITTRGLVNILITEEEVGDDREDTIRRNQDYLYGILTPKKAQTFFQNKDTACWSWCMAGSSPAEENINTRGLKRTEQSIVYISIIAYIAVRRYLTGSPKEFKMTFDSDSVHSRLGISDVYLLFDETDAVCSWFSFKCDVPEEEENQLGYFAWWYKGFDSGKMHEATAVEKYNKCLSFDFKVGDIISLYERKPLQLENLTKEIENFHFAIIRGISRKGIDLEIIHTTKTYFTGLLEFKNYSMSVKAMYGDKHPYKSFTSTRRFFDWLDIGVEYLLHTELFFITPIYDGDGKYIKVNDNGTVINLWVSQQDFIYWVLQDYQVEFNEKHFLDTYFKNRVPMYNRYSHDEVGKIYKY